MPSRNPLLPPAAEPANDPAETVDSSHPDRVIFRGGSQENSSNINSTNSTANDNEPHNEEEPIVQPNAPIPIHSKTKNWYSNFCNRWASLFGAVIKVIIMLLVNWYYAITSIVVVFLIWFYVGTANPAVKPGLAAEFRLFVWARGIVFRCFGYVWGSIANVYSKTVTIILYIQK